MKSGDDKKVKTEISIEDNEVVKPLLQEINRAKTANKTDKKINSDIQELIQKHLRIIYDNSKNGDKDTEDYLIYLFGNLDIEWNTMIQNKILLKYAADKGYIHLLDSLLQSIQNRKIDTKPGGFSPIWFFDFESLGGQPLAVLELLTKKYKFQVSFDWGYYSSRSCSIDSWPMNNCTLLQVLAVKGEYNQVLRLLVEFKANPNLKTSLPYFSAYNTLNNGREGEETALTKMILTVMEDIYRMHLGYKVKFTKVFVQNYCNIVKALAAYGLNLTDTDKVYLRIAEGHKKDETGKEYTNRDVLLGANCYLLKTVKPDAQKLRSNIFTHMMRAYHEGKQIQKEVSERTQQDIFIPKEPYKAQNTKNDDSKSNDADKIPDLSNIHTLFANSPPVVNIINEYDQILKYNLEQELQKDAKKGGEPPSLYSDDDEENQNNLRGQQP